MTKNLWNISPLFKCSNINYLKNIVDTRETLKVKVREIVGLSAPMNKIGRPTYLSNDMESLIVVAAEIEGGHGLPLESNFILGQLQCVIKAVKLLCGDNDIINNATPQLFMPSLQVCQ